MKGGLALLVVAACASSASARLVALATEAAFHTDEWCQEHHLGEGPATCIQHDGCCYDGRIGQCHSCDAHSDDWCKKYGEKDPKLCAGYAGCTYDFADDKCISNSDPTAFEDEVTCEEALADALEGQGVSALKGNDGQSLVEYTPQCTKDGMWEEEQFDEQTQFRWCVDANGHEIPDTRKQDAMFAHSKINCNKERKTHAGMQCPNAVTLSTKGGEVMINDHPDVGNCDVRCNTDQDCKGEDWCCYNGCGYSCQTAISPKADCQHISLDASLQATDLSRNPIQNIGKAHGTTVMISCAEGHSGGSPTQVTCKHGKWNSWDIECFKDCEQHYRVPSMLRQRDYDVKGFDNSHGSKRKIRCVTGYGAVSGEPDAFRTWKETLECINGAWEEQSLVCSSCYDAPQSGPRAWWTGKADTGGNYGKAMGKNKAPVAGGTSRKDSFDCQYFASRPHKCAEYPDARENCRISCRTCEVALIKYKVKAVSHVMDGDRRPVGLSPEEKRKWINTRIKKLEGTQDMVTKDKRSKVAKRVKKDVPGTNMKGK